LLLFQPLPGEKNVAHLKWNKKLGVEVIQNICFLESQQDSHRVKFGSHANGFQTTPGELLRI
jgi:hypothetical protein